jgi:tetratricopeptide (TPR) repeat protein
MRAHWLSIPLVLVAAALTTQAWADSTTKGKKSEAKSDPASDVPGVVRRDPKGVTGVSPCMEAVLKGNGAYAARDFAKATEAYQEAITKDPNDPLGHYMLGEAQLAEGKLDEADRSWQNALRASGAKDAMHAKALFVIADLRERQGRWDDAETAWKEYASFVGAHSKANGYAATATERLKMIATHKELAVSAGKVKERIQQRIDESKQKDTKPEPAKKGK